MSALLVGYREFLTVSRVTDSSRMQSETEDRLVLTVSDVALPTARSPSSGHDATSPSVPIILRVEFDRAGFLKKAVPGYREFLRPLLRSQAFMNYCEDAGVAGELMRLHNLRHDDADADTTPVAPGSARGSKPTLSSSSSSGGGGSGKSKDGVVKGSAVSSFGWGGGDGPLNDDTAGLVRDMISGVDRTGRYWATRVDSALEADAVYIRLFDWTIMRHMAVAKDSGKGSGSVGDVLSKIASA